MTAHAPIYDSTSRQGRDTPELPPQTSSLPDWEGPTLRQFVRQIEHEFGRSLDLSSLRHAGIGGDEALDPSDIRQLCDLLGLPAEDFGVS